MSGLNICVS